MSSQLRKARNERKKFPLNIEESNVAEKEERNSSEKQEEKSLNELSEGSGVFNGESSGSEGFVINESASKKKQRKKEVESDNDSFVQVGSDKASDKAAKRTDKQSKLNKKDPDEKTTNSKLKLWSTTKKEVELEEDDSKLLQNSANKNKAADSDRSKSTNRIFRKLGEKQDKRDFGNSDVFDLSVNEKKRPVSRNVFGRRGDDEQEKGNVLHQSDLFKNKSSAFDNAFKSTRTEQPPQDSDQGNETTLGQKLRQILEGERQHSKSPNVQSKRKDEKSVDELIAKVRNKSPITRSIAKDNKEPEERLKDIRARMEEKRAKSRIVAPRVHENKANLFQNEFNDLVEPKQPHRSFLKDPRNSDLQQLESLKLANPETRMSRVNKQLVVEPEAEEEEAVGYKALREKKRLEKERNREKLQESHSADDSDDNREPKETVVSKRNTRLKIESLKEIAEVEHKETTFEKRVSKRQSVPEEEPFHGSPNIKRPSDEGLEWEKIDEEKKKFSEIKKKSLHIPHESIDFTESLLGNMNPEDNNKELSHLLSPSKKEETQRSSIIGSGIRKKKKEEGDVPKVSFHFKEESDRKSDEMESTERRVDTKIALAALDLGALPDLTEQPVPKRDESRRSERRINLVAEEEKQQVPELSDNRPVSQRKSFNTSDDRPLKQSAGTYNFDDPNFKDTYVPSGKVGKANLNRKSTNVPKEDVQQALSEPKETVLVTEHQSEVIVKKGVDKSEANAVPNSSFVNAEFTKLPTSVPSESVAKQVDETEQLLNNDGGFNKMKMPKRNIGAKPPKKTEVEETIKAAAEPQEELVNVVEPPKAKPPLKGKTVTPKQSEAVPESTDELNNVVEAPKAKPPRLQRFQKPALQAEEKPAEAVVEEKKQEETIVETVEPPKAKLPRLRGPIKATEEEPVKATQPTEEQPKKEEPPVTDTQQKQELPPTKETVEPVAVEKPKEEEKAEDPNSLSAKLKSTAFKVRAEAYQEIATWKTEISPEVFAKNLHNYIKDKHPISVEALMATCDSFFDNHSQLFTQIDFKGLIENISEHLLSNVKGASKEKAMEFIVRVWELSNFDVFLEQLNALLTSGKPKRQEACLNIVMELVKNHKIDEMKQLKPLWTEIGKLINSRTVALKNMTIELYKEVFLWIQDALRPFLKDLKKQQMDELDSYFKSLDASKFKKVEKKVRVPKALPTAPTADKGTPAASSNDKTLPVTASPDKTAVPATPTAKDYTAADDVVKNYNNSNWTTQVSNSKTPKEQVAKIDEATDKMSKLTNLNPATDYSQLTMALTKCLGSQSTDVRGAAAKLVKVVSSKLGKSFATASKDIFKLMLPKLSEKATNDIYSQTLNCLFNSLSVEDVFDDLKLALSNKNNDLVIQTLQLLKSAAESQDKLQSNEKTSKLSELVIKFAEDKSADLKSIAQHIIATQFAVSEAKVQPVIKGLSQAVQNSISQTALAMKQSSKTALGREEGTGEVGEGIGRRNNAKSNLQRIIQIKEDTLSNKIVKTSDAKQFPAHLTKEMNFLNEATGEFRDLFPEEAAEIVSFVESIMKLERIVLPEVARQVIFQFYAEQFNMAWNEQLQTSFDAFYAFVLKSTSNKVLLEQLLGLLLKKQIRAGREFFQVLVNMFEKEVSSQAAVTGLPLRQFTDYLKFIFGAEGIQIIFKKLLTNTMRLLMKKFGDQSVADFPAVILREFDAINEAQKVFEKIIEKLNDRNPERRKAALVDLANYTDPSTILTFWSNDKFVSFLKRQITIETKSANYLVLIRILDHYLDIRNVSPADFNMKTFIFIFHAVLMNFYDRKEEPHAKETEALIRRAVSILTPTLVLNEMISADSNALAWREQVLHFLNEYSAEVEPSIRVLNYLITLLGQKNPPREFQELLTKVFLRYKATGGPEILAKGAEVRAIRDIWAKNEEDLVIGSDFLKGLSFENPEKEAATREYLMKSLKIDEKQFWARNISLLEFRGSEASFKTKMAFWLIRSVENDARNNYFIINQIYAKTAHQDDDVSGALALKITLQILKNLHYDPNAECVSLALALIQQIASFYKDSRLEEIAEMLNLDYIDYEFLNYLLSVAEVYHGANNYTAVPSNIRQTNNPRSLNATGSIPPTNTQSVNQRPPQIQMRADDYESEPQSAQKYQQSQYNNYQEERGSADPMREPTGRGPVQNWREEGPLEDQMRLQEMFNLMRTYQLDEFEAASAYFKELCASKRAVSINFLVENRDEILDNFLEICQTIFNEGINYELKREDYDLIFSPLTQLFDKENFLLSMGREKTSLLFEFLINQFTSASEQKKEVDPSVPGVLETTEYIVKVWNVLLLKLIDHANPNYTVQSLFLLVNSDPNLVRSRKVEAEVTLALRCLSRFSKNLAKHMAGLSPAVVLDCLNTYMKSADLSNPEELGTKVVQNLLTDLVGLVGVDSVLENYYVLCGKSTETTLYKWIKLISRGKSEFAGSGDPTDQLIELINELNKQPASSNLKNYFSRFQKHLSANPELKLKDFEEYFVTRNHYIQVSKAMAYYSASSSNDQKQGQTVPQSKSTKNVEKGTLQVTATPLTSRVVQSTRQRTRAPQTDQYDD